MSIYLSSPWASQSFLGCGPSYLPTAMDLYEEALYAQAVRERQRRIAVQRELELRRQRKVEAMMQRMAIESAMRDLAEREYQRALARRQAELERKRAEQEGKAKAPGNGHLYLQLGDMLFRLMPQASDEESGEACDNLAPLTSDIPKEPAKVEAPASATTPAETLSKPAEPETAEVTLGADVEPVREPEATPEADQTPTAAPEPVAEASPSEPQDRVLFSYDFPDATSAYGRDIRKHVKSDNLHVEANTLNGGSIKISGLWRKTAPSPSSRASSPRSPHVRDVDEDGNEILLAEDTDSDSDSEQGVSFTESVVIPLPSLDELRNMRAELDDAGFKLWTTV